VVDAGGGKFTLDRGMSTEKDHEKEILSVGGQEGFYQGGNGGGGVYNLRGTRTGWKKKPLW